MKAVFDTNVYISAFLTRGGNADRAYRAALDRSFGLFTSVPILTELANKLRDKFAWEDERIADAVRHISSVAAVLKPRKTISILRDEPDNRILECGRAAGADVIVTGDKHLLGLKEFEEMRMVKIAEFLKMLG